jgi:uncharacterized protein (DUF1684 family)
MKNISIIILLFLCTGLFAQKNNDSILLQGKEFQDKMNEDYSDKEHSPLTPEDLAKFETLPFFEIDSTYYVIARFEKAKKSKSIKFKTSTDRRPKYEIYGTVYFTIKGAAYSLHLYQSHRLREMEEFKTHLFLPFTDLSTGAESYGGGRYLDLEIPEGETIIIDFNHAYNPYCAYSGRYSCPVVPDKNFIDVKVLAGVMAPGKH